MITGLYAKEKLKWKIHNDFRLFNKAVLEAEVSCCKIFEIKETMLILYQIYIRDLESVVIYSMLSFYLRVEHKEPDSKSVKTNKRLSLISIWYSQRQCGETALCWHRTGSWNVIVVICKFGGVKEYWLCVTRLCLNLLRWICTKYYYCSMPTVSASHKSIAAYDVS